MKEKLTVMAVSFALFAAGVAALQLDRGALRTGLLIAVFAALGAVVLRQSLRGKK